MGAEPRLNAGHAIPLEAVEIFVDRVESVFQTELHTGVERLLPTRIEPELLVNQLPEIDVAWSLSSPPYCPIIWPPISNLSWNSSYRHSIPQGGLHALVK